MPRSYIIEIISLHDLIASRLFDPRIVTNHGDCQGSLRYFRYITTIPWNRGHLTLRSYHVTIIQRHDRIKSRSNDDRGTIVSHFNNKTLRSWEITSMKHHKLMNLTISQIHFATNRLSSRSFELMIELHNDRETLRNIKLQSYLHYEFFVNSRFLKYFLYGRDSVQPGSS